MSTSTTGSTPPPTEPEAAQPPARSRGMRGSGWSMVISMLVILGGVLIWIAIVPRPSEKATPVTGLDGLAREINKQQGWTVSLPRGLGETWVPTNVRLMNLEDQPKTWHAGYQTPSGEYASLEQTKSPKQSWIAKMTAGGKPGEKVTIGGASWTKYLDGSSNQQAIVRDEPLNGLATVVMGKAGMGELQTLAGALQPTSAE